MTTVAIAGRITEIEYEDSFAIVSLSDGKEGVDAPTTISPSGKPVTIVIGTNTPFTGSGTPSGFILSSTFNIGDVVEVYLSDASLVSGFGSIKVFDENNNLIVVSEKGCILRKLTTGTGNNWGPVAKSL